MASATPPPVCPAAKLLRQLRCNAQPLRLPRLASPSSSLSACTDARPPGIAEAHRSRSSARIFSPTHPPGFLWDRERIGAGGKQHGNNGAVQCWPRHGAWGAGDTCPLPPPLFLLITPTQQPRRHQRRLKALVGAEPAESPEGHGAGDWGGGARRLGARCESWESSTRPS